MGYIRVREREQETLLSGNIEDYVSQENPVRVIDAFVDGLDMQAAGFERYVPARTGRPAYDPRDLLKLYLYGYLNRVRSSRMLMRECGRNVELFFLLNHAQPDFRTIADFRKRNRKAIQAVFREFVGVCGDLKLLGTDTAVIDGTKIRAVNSKKRSFTPEILKKKLAYLAEQEQQLARYLGELDAADETQESSLSLPRDKAQEKLTAVRERARKYRGYRERLRKTGEKQLLETDPEAYTMHTKDGLFPCYNIQTTVEDKNHIITAFLATNLNNDQGQLHSAADEARRAVGVDSLHVIADRGYESRPDIEHCMLDGIIPDVGFKYDKDERIHVIDYIPTDIAPELRASSKPADIRTCLYAGVLPDRYQNSSIRVELQHLGEISCFLRHKDGRVTCPMGKELFKRTTRANGGTDYSSRDACRTQPLHTKQGNQDRPLRPGYRICAGGHVRQQPLRAPAPSRESPPFPRQQL